MKSVRVCLRRKNIFVNQIFCQNFNQIDIISKYIKKEIEKRTSDFLWSDKKIKVPGYLVQLSIWRGRLGILDMDTDLNPLKYK